MRPAILHVNGVLYWVVRTYNPDTLQLKDADSTPTVAVRKNGASVGDSVTITKRSATTGIYDCSYNPAGEVEGDEFTIEETATITGTTTAQATYSQSWAFTVIALERGSDTAPDNASITAIKAKTDNLPSDPADASDIASSFSTVNSTLATIATYIDTEVAAIKAKTDNLPTDPADQSAVEAAITSAVTSIKGADSDTLKTLSDQIDLTATAANQTKTLDRLGYLMAQEIGACADAGTSAESYAITIDTTTYTIDHTGLDATGNRGTATLTKS